MSDGRIERMLAKSLDCFFVANNLKDFIYKICYFRTCRIHTATHLTLLINYQKIGIR